MITLTFTPDKRSVTCERKDYDQVSSRFTSLFKNNADFDKAARELRVDKSRIMKAICDSQDKQEPITIDLTPRAEDTKVYLRARLQGNAEALAFDTLAECIDYTLFSHQEPLIYWKSEDELAALDIDYHSLPIEKRPDLAFLRRLMGRVDPRPSLTWRTHGGGFRAIYTRQGNYLAGEIAAIAGLAYKMLDPLCTYEIKTVTRHPYYPVNERKCSEVFRHEQTTDMGVVARLFNVSGCTPDEVESYLQEHDYVMGERYEHDRCPQCPDTKVMKRKPVIVREEGIYCHLCAANSYCYASRVPGWFSFDALLGRKIPTMLSRCVSNFTHWEHARYVWEEKLGISENAGRLAYSAALKMFHGVDERISRVFSTGKNLIRYSGRWGTNQGESYDSNCAAILATLPVCTTPEMCERFGQTHDLSGYGYPALYAIYGHRIYSHRLPFSDLSIIPVVVQPTYLASDEARQYRVKYEKGDVEEAWKTIEEVCPGVNRGFVNLLIAAKGCVEEQVGMNPLIFAYGQTGSAKSSSVTLAATIAGDVNSEIIWTPSIERNRQAILDAKEVGTIVTFNEILKEKGFNIQTGRDKLDMILNLTPDSRSHKMYRGSVKLGTLPVIVFTDTTIPGEVKADAQLARRIVAVHLREKVDWESSLRFTGVNQVKRIRTTNAKLTHACNVVFSNVIDTYFDQPRTFKEIARELGFSTLEDSEEAIDARNILASFFDEVCRTPNLSDTDAVRWSGRGWKLIDRNHESSLLNMWKDLCDENGDSRRCSEANWKQILNLRNSVQFETRSHGGKTVVRFISRRSTKDYLVNEELRK